jgi:hypothetical protein
MVAVPTGRVEEGGWTVQPLDPAAAGRRFVGVLANGGRVLIRNGDGTTLSGPQARRRFGTESVMILRARGNDAVPVPRRARYFAFRGSRAERKRLRLAVAARIKQCPKRLPHMHR